MASKMEWNGDGASKHVRARALIAVQLICFAIVQRAKILLSVPGTGKVKGKKTGPVTHAPAGEPPYKQTGRLRASVTSEVDEETLSGRVGTNVDYGYYLELGTKRGIPPHPWLRPAYEWVMARLGSILAPLNRS